MVITEKDVEEGKRLAAVFEKLTEEDKNQCLVYMSALLDRQAFAETQDQTKRQQERGE